MSYLSIAILRKKMSPGEEEHYEYLVQHGLDGIYRFLNVNSLLNGRFDYSKITKSVNDYFELSNSDQLDKPVPFARSRKPAGASYVFELTDNQHQKITQLIAEHPQDEKWKYLKWLKQNDLREYIQSWDEGQKFIFDTTEPFDSPKFSNDIKAGLRNIVSARNQGRLVIFAGAGVSVESSVPGWADLISGLQGDIDESIDDYLELAQAYIDKHGNKEFQERLRDILKFGRTKYNPIHEKIVNINPLHIVTTNFDNHFEQIHEEKGFKYSIVKKDADLPYSKSESLYVKMHGDLGERNIILTKDQFNNYHDNFPLIDGFVRGLFASKLVLFVGFSFDDPNLKEIRKWVGNILESDGQRPYIILNTISQKRREKLELEDKLNVIEIGTPKTQTAVSKYFEQISTEDEKETSNKLNDNRSRTLYKFLSVINEYDPLADSLEIVPMKEQFKNSLRRFLELQVIPNSVIEHLYPFKVKGNPIDNKFLQARLEYGVLETPNENFLKFLKEISDKEGNIHFYSYGESKRNSDEQELDKIWKLLYNSGVSIIKRSNDTSSEKYRLKPERKENQCNCSRCRLDKFEFEQLLCDLTKLHDKCLSRHSSSDIDLAHAYGFFKVGYVLKAYYILEEIKTSSWKQNKFITYFLACYNQKKLRPFIWYGNAQFYEEIELDTIQLRIDKMDLDRILVELPVEKDVKSVLSIIKNESFIDDTVAFIDEKHTKTLDLLKQYSKNISLFHSGPNYLNHSFLALRRLLVFYNYNHLFAEEDKKFKLLSNKFLETFLASNLIDGVSPTRGLKVVSLFGHVAIRFSESKYLIQLLQKYKFEELSFDEFPKDKDNFLLEFEKLTTSGYSKNQFGNQQIGKKDIHEMAAKNSNIYSHRTKQFFNNSLILFSHISFEEDKINSIIDQSLNYLEVSDNFQYIDSLEFWQYFIIKKIQYISKENILRIIRFLLSDKPNGLDVADTICTAIVNETEYTQILDEHYLKMIIDKYHQQGYYKEKIFCFYNLLYKEYKEEFYKFIYDDLLKYSSSFKTEAWLNNVWNPIDNSDILISFIKDLKKSVSNFKTFKIDEESNVTDLDDFTTWNNLIYLGIWTYKYNLFEHKEVKSLQKLVGVDLFRWLLNPFSFDYEKFDIKWLGLFKGDDYLKVWLKVDNFTDILKEKISIEYNERASGIYFKLVKLQMDNESH
ncbi:hypothetical protein G5B10_07700 [Fluviicola sp. SGL-29]|nr:hypothetical protein [Fluviicola sp. SGL-29]